MAIEGYEYTADRFPELYIARFFPERTKHETLQLRDYLRAHAHEFTRVMFSVRIGQGVHPDPSIPPRIAVGLVRSSRRRIDLVGWNGDQATLVEAKTYCGHQVMGQLVSDFQLWREEFPTHPPPRLVAVGRFSSDDDIRILNAN